MQTKMQFSQPAQLPAQLQVSPPGHVDEPPSAMAQVARHFGTDEPDTKTHSSPVGHWPDWHWKNWAHDSDDAAKPSRRRTWRMAAEPKLPRCASCSSP